MTAQIALHIALQRRLQAADLGQHGRVVQLLLGGTAHRVGILTALRTVLGFAVTHHIDKLLELLVRDRKRLRIQRLQTCVVRLRIVVGEVLNVPLGVDRHHKS